MFCGWPGAATFADPPYAYIFVFGNPGGKTCWKIVFSVTWTIGTFLPSCRSNFVPLGTKVAGRVNWFTTFGTVLASRGCTVVLADPVGIFDQSGLCIDMPLRMCWGVAVCCAAGAD